MGAAGDIDNMEVVRHEYDSARKQVGTLGGGNHFIELQKGSDNHIWIMIHSGSRNIGKKVADFYNKKARSLNTSWNKKLNVKQDLAFLPCDMKEAQKYVNILNKGTHGFNVTNHLLETSAKTGQNVDKAFEMLGNAIRARV